MTKHTHKEREVTKTEERLIDHHVTYNEWLMFLIFHPQVKFQCPTKTLLIECEEHKISEWYPHIYPTITLTIYRGDPRKDWAWSPKFKCWTMPKSGGITNTKMRIQNCIMASFSKCDDPVNGDQLSNSLNKKMCMTQDLFI